MSFNAIFGERGMLDRLAFDHFPSGGRSNQSLLDAPGKRTVSLDSFPCISPMNTAGS